MNEWLHSRLTSDIDEREFVTRYLGNMNIRIWTKRVLILSRPIRRKSRLSHVIHGLIRLSTVLLPTCLIFLAATFQAPSNNSGAVISDDSLKVHQGQATYINRTGDILVYYGTKEDIAIPENTGHFAGYDEWWSGCFWLCFWGSDLAVWRLRHSFSG